MINYLIKINEIALRKMYIILTIKLIIKFYLYNNSAVILYD